MERTKTENSIANLLIMALVIFVAASNLFAQDYQEITISDPAIENLTTGITSDNYGLKRNCIYFAGKYKIKEAVPVIIEELNSTNDRRIKILAARVLYEIGNRTGMNAVRELALTDTTKQVQRICTAIYNAYVVETDPKYFAKGN